MDEADDEAFGVRHDRMQVLADELFRTTPEMMRVWVTAMGAAEEGSFVPEKVAATITPETRSELDTFFAAESSKGEVELNSAMIAAVHGDTMELHVPPLNGNPIKLYRAFLDGLQKAADLAQSRGIQNIVLTSWIIGDLDPKKFAAYGGVSEDGIPEDVRREAGYGGALYNSKHFERYIQTGELPRVKTVQFTPDSLKAFLQSQ
jgi:hypothetical protein